MAPAPQSLRAKYGYLPMTLRRLTSLIAVLLAGVLFVAGCGSSSSSSSTTATSSSATASASATTSAGKIGYAGIPLEQGPELAPGGTTAQGQTIDGVQCGATEQLVYHIHAHLAVYVDGKSRAIPAGVGIAGAIVQNTQFGPVVGNGSCFYWLHTHTTDGVLHVESPTQRIYTLGNFFDVWRQPLSANQAGPAKGKITAVVDGKPWTKDPRLIPLQAHSAIQLDVGTPIAPFQPVSFAGTSL
jgi:hypothetical protein